MATDQALIKLSGLVAEQDMSGTGFQHRFMKAGTSAGQVNRCAALTENPLGVLCNRPYSGKSATLAILGKKKVVAGAAIDRGASVGTDAQGRAIPVAAGAAAAGVALQAAAQAGDLVEIELRLGSLAYG